MKAPLKLSLAAGQGTNPPISPLPIPGGQVEQNLGQATLFAGIRYFIDGKVIGEEELNPLESSLSGGFKPFQKG